MEKKNTALQELENWLKSFDDYPTKPTHRNVIEKCWQLLSKEKEQISNAYEKGMLHNTKVGKFADGNHYYTSTYNQI
jgi:hypothetical protein